MIFFYEILFVVVALIAVFLGEQWSRTLCLVFLGLWFGLATLGHLSFKARLAAGEGLRDDDRRWFEDARDGLKHLRLLFGVAAAGAVVWRLLAG